MNAGMGSADIQLAVIKYITDHLAAVRKTDLAPGVVAALAPGARLPIKIGDTLVGWLSIPKPSRKAAIVNEAKFLTWVQDNHPTEIVPSVRGSFTDLVLRSVRERGGWLDKSTGELTDVPGVERSFGDPYPKVDLEDGAGDVIGAAWRGGLIDIGHMLALEGGGEAA